MALPARTRTGRQKVTFAETTIDLAAIGADTVEASNDVKIPGAQYGDVVTVNWNNESAALDIKGYVSAANTVTIVVVNGTAGSINAASATFTLAVFHRD